MLLQVLRHFHWLNENFRASFLYITKNLNLVHIFVIFSCVNFAQKVLDIKVYFFFNFCACTNETGCLT